MRVYYIHSTTRLGADKRSPWRSQGHQTCFTHAMKRSRAAAVVHTRTYTHAQQRRRSSVRYTHTKYHANHTHAAPDSGGTTIIYICTQHTHTCESRGRDGEKRESAQSAECACTQTPHTTLPLYCYHSYCTREHTRRNNREHTK